MKYIPIPLPIHHQLHNSAWSPVWLASSPPVTSHQVETQLRLCFGNYVIICADYCPTVAFVYNRDKRLTYRPDSRCMFLFNFILQEHYLWPRIDGDIRNKCRLYKLLMKWVDRFFVGFASTSPVGTSIFNNLYTSVDDKVLNKFWWELWN